MYWGSKEKGDGHGRNCALTSLNEFFLVLVRLRLGLFERDLANRFSVSVSSLPYLSYLDPFYVFKIQGDSIVAKPRFGKFIYAQVF